jgi:NTE family protein
MTEHINEEVIQNSDQQVVEPVQYMSDEAGKKPEPGMALCLSGGGYRAMLFHVGVLWRLNEFGLLPKLKRISSVSGGSIASGVLAMNWHRLGFENGVARHYEKEVVAPIKKLASRTVDAASVVTGALWTGSIGDKVLMLTVITFSAVRPCRIS